MLSAARRKARRTPWMPLLSAVLELAQGQAELLRHSERAWASVTFSGSKHTVVLAFDGADKVLAGETLIDALPEHEFTLPRLLVADAAVVRVEHSALPQPRLEVEVELLVLDEA
ncbi:MAG: hypothetical protein IT549_02950 [Novosphingobium sp.]|nr:hypothetical protein [Novosphingobium sp.]